MPIKLSVPIIKEFVLEKSDKIAGNEKEPTKISVRQATQGERDIIDSKTQAFQRQFNRDGTMNVTQNISYVEIIRLHVQLTLAACNLQDMTGKPLFTFENGRIVNEEDFLSGWAALPPYIADEIHEKVLEVNKLWSESGK